MNLTIGNTFPNTWKRIKAQYIAAALGVALAASSVLAVAAWPSGDSAMPSAARNVAPAPAVEQPAARPVQFYLVDSQADSDALLQAQEAGRQAGVVQPFDVVPVVVQSDVQAQQTQLDLFSASQAIGQQAQVIDLRGR